MSADRLDRRSVPRPRPRSPPGSAGSGSSSASTTWRARRRGSPSAGGARPRQPRSSACSWRCWPSASPRRAGGSAADSGSWRSRPGRAHRAWPHLAAGLDAAAQDPGRRRRPLRGRRAGDRGPCSASAPALAALVASGSAAARRSLPPGSWPRWSAGWVPASSPRPHARLALGLPARRGHHRLLRQDLDQEPPGRAARHRPRRWSPALGRSTTAPAWLGPSTSTSRRGTDVFIAEMGTYGPGEIADMVLVVPARGRRAHRHRSRAPRALRLARRHRWRPRPRSPSARARWW